MWMIYGLMICHSVYNFVAVYYCRVDLLVAVMRISLVAALVVSMSVPSSVVITVGFYLCVCYLIQCVMVAVITKEAHGYFWYIAALSMWSIGLRISYEYMQPGWSAYLVLIVMVFLAIGALVEKRDNKENDFDEV